MEDFYINNTSQDNSDYYSNTSNSYYYSNTSNSYNYSNNTSNYDYYNSKRFIVDVATYIITGIGLPLTLVAICALYSEVKNNHVAPIYVINLLISDLIQFCCTVVEALLLYYQLGLKQEILILSKMYLCSLLVSVGFMVCIALERFLVVVCPLWYRCRRTIKTSVVVSVMVWALILVVLLTFYFWVHPEITDTVFGIFLLLPLPVFIFFLGGILKALSASRVPSDEKRRIVGILVLVLLIYTLLFLPSITGFLAEKKKNNYTFEIVSRMFIRLSPLADLVLYVFMRKGTIDKLLASVCCCRMDSNDISSSSV